MQHASSSGLTRNPNLDIVSAAAFVPSGEAWERNLGRCQLPCPRTDDWWTGPHPEKADCPGRTAEGWIAALPMPKLDACNEREVQDYFANGWVLTELLFASLREEEAFYRPPYHNLRHPLVFYYVHPAVLYINKLRVAGLLDQGINPYYEQIFETGVDEMSWDDLSKNEMDWPDLEACRDYRQAVFQRVSSLIQEHPGLRRGHEPITMDSPLWALFLGFEHERIHLETSSVLMRELPLRLVQRPKAFPPLHPSSVPLKFRGDRLDVLGDSQITNDSEEARPTSPLTPAKKASKACLFGHRVNSPQPAPENPFLEVESGEALIGKARDFPTFGWDNEYGRDLRQVSAFKAQQHPVTNGEFYEFVKAGGYREPRFWSEEGWRWRSFRNVKWPTFWAATGAQGAHEYALRCCFEMVEMPAHWPVVVNYYEAKAYACWLSEKEKRANPLRLLTEAEHHRLRQYSKGPALDALRWGSEGPVNADGQSFGDVFGNVWTWLEDDFHPLSGFKPHPYYDDFSTPCFDGRHQMIGGSSFISVGDEASPHARFHFRPHFFQHAGFRLVDSLEPDNNGSAIKIEQHTSESAEASRPFPTHFDWPIQEIERGFSCMVEALAPYWEQLRAHPDDPNGTFQKGLRGPSASITENNPFKDSTLPEEGMDLGRLLPQVAQALGAHDEMIGHPGYLAYLAGAAQPVAAIGQALAMLMNPFTGTAATAPRAVALEEQVIHWMLAMMDFPHTGGGWITSGSSLAIFNAVLAAREARPGPVGQRRVYVSDQAHHAIAKALFGAGFSAQELCVIPSEEGRLSPNRVLEQIQKDRQDGLKPILLVATAGTTNSGQVDPLMELQEIAKNEDLWYHVDAAYGGFFKLLPSCTAIQGLERADSLSLDLHKSLYMPYGTGVLLVRDRHQLTWPRSAQASYMPEPEQSLPDYGDFSPELSRDFRGLRVWLSLKSFGLQHYRKTLSEKLQQAALLAKWIQAEPALELTAAPVLTLLTFRVKDDPDDGKTRSLLQAINGSGRFFLSSCRMDGRLHIRVCVLGFRTETPTLEDLMQLMRGIVG